MVNTKGNVGAGLVLALISIGTVYLLTEYGITKGLPSQLSFVVSVAAIFGLLIIQIKLR